MNLEQLRTYKPQILKLSEENGISNIRVFGSVVRGDADEKSDVDLLVSVADGVGMKFFGYGESLEHLLGCHVDVLSDRSHFLPHQQKIFKEAVPLFPDENTH